MLKRDIWLLSPVIAFGAPAAFARGAEAPAVTHPESAAVLKALGAPVSKDLKQEVTFSAGKLKVGGDWAFVAGRARDAGGGGPNWKLTKYQGFIVSNDFEDNLFALLKKKDGEWRAVTYMVNCHDVCHLGWDRRYKAPEAIFE